MFSLLTDYHTQLMCLATAKYSFASTNTTLVKQTCLLNHGRPFTGGHSSHALRLGPLGGARRTQMRSSALGVLPQCPRGLMLDCARHTSHCESNFGSFCRGCPTQRSRVPSSVCRPRLVSLVVLFGGCVALGALLG